jgi:integrase
MSKKETRSEQKIPKQLAIFRQKRRGRQDTAFTVIDGRRIHLGIYGTPEAEKEYRRVVAEWNTGIIAPKQTSTADITVAELVLRFLKERQQKVSHTQWDNERRAAIVLVSLYGDLDAVAFDVNCLRTVRNEFIQKGYVRQKINWRVRVVQLVFRWGVSYKLVPANVHHELKTLMPIKKGEYDLPESRKRPIVSLADIEKTLAKLSPVIRAMVIIHLATAARPTEVCEMRIENIDRQSENLWAVKLDHHKTDHLENAETKILYLAKPEIDVLLPLIGERTEGYIFRPSDTIRYEKERRATGAVFVKKQPSRAARDAERAQNPKLEIGECYHFSAYRKAVYRACDRAGIARWFPYQLRHTGITLIGLEHGVGAAQHTAGHKDIKMTLRYFRGENEIAKRVALARNKPATAPNAPQEEPPPKTSTGQDAVIAELLQQNQKLLEMLAQKRD